VGPTAVGKTALSLSLAAQFRGEIISADSRQVYRYMDIGTAKATPSEQALVPHHLLDVVDPDQVLTLAQFQGMAHRAIAAAHKRGALPILVGGSGLYVRAVLEGWAIPHIRPNPALRAELEAFAAQHGAQELHRQLAAVDSDAAAAIDARNVRRVIRALEVHRITGQPISELQTKHDPGYRLFTIGLTMDRPALYGRIDERVDRMVAAGLVDEVQALLQRGYTAKLPSMTGLGYRQIVQALDGEVSLDEAIALIKRQTRRFVRQQYNWFQLNDPTIRWYDVTAARSANAEESGPYRAITNVVDAWLTTANTVDEQTRPSIT
jgi:tRNA dimethylallyltransferase